MPICDVACWRAVSTSFMAWSCAWPMSSVPWPLEPEPPPAPAPPLAPSAPLRARSLEFPAPLDPDAPDRDCSLLVDSRDWAIDDSFFQNWERPRGRPPERSSSLVQHGRASRGRNGL